MTVKLVLEAHNRSAFTLSKYFIQDVLTGSILAQALEIDPDVKEISIPNLVVTPKAMQVLVNLSRGLEPISHDLDLRPAAVYLNCERLMVYTYSAYDHNIAGYSDIGVNDSGVGYSLAIRQKALCVVKYRLQKGYIPATNNLELAWGQNQPDMVRLLLPCINRCWYFVDVLNWACKNGHLDIVQMILGKDDHKDIPAIQRVNLESALVNASKHGHADIVRCLLKNPRLEGRDIGQAIAEAQKGGHSEIEVQLKNFHPNKTPCSKTSKHCNKFMAPGQVS